MTRRRWVWLALAAALVLLAGRAIAEAVVERRWLTTLGPGGAQVWRARTESLLLLRGACAAVGALAAFANLAAVAASVRAVVLSRRLGGLEIGETVSGTRLLGVAALASLAIGLLLTMPADAWMLVELVRYGRPFGDVEPHLGHDVGFHVYWLPFENAAYVWSLLVLVTCAAVVVVLYALTPGLRWERGRVRMSAHVRRHATALGAALLLLLAWGHRLDAYALLTDGSGVAGAFTYLDATTGIPARFGLAVFTAVCAAVVLRAGWVGQLRLAFWTVTLVVVASFTARAAAQLIAARLVAPDRLARMEQAYAATRALYTQRAFAVDAVAPLPADAGLDSLAALSERVPVWDPAVLARAVERSRRTGTVVSDVGWQAGSGGVVAVAVERPTVRDDAPVPTWVALVLDALRGDELGRPVLAVDPTLPLAEGGQRVAALVHPDAVGPAIVADPEERVVGDPLAGWPVRLAHAWARRDLRLAFSDAVGRTEAPEIVLHRDVRERVAALVPFFVQGHLVTPALVGDSLHWVVHLYSATAAYPLSQHYAIGGVDRSYLRHAATAVVGAQSGSVRVVPAPEPDPIARTWLARLPALGTPATALDATLASAIPPAADAILVQAWALAQFGEHRAGRVVTRRIPGGEGGDSTLGVAQRAPVLLPPPPAVRPPRRARSAANTVAPDRAAGAASAATLLPAWTLPLLDAGGRVDGVVVGYGGAAPSTRWLAASGPRPRWSEVLEAARTAALLSPGVGADSGSGTAVPTAPSEPRATAAADPPRTGSAPAGGQDPGGVGRGPESALVRGRVRTIPLARSLAYVQPTFAVGPDGVPALAEVAVLAGDSVRRGATLTAVVSGRAPDARAAGSAGAERLGRARALYAAMRAALRRGDWAAFGAALEALGEAVGAVGNATATPERRTPP